MSTEGAGGAASEIFVRLNGKPRGFPADVTVRGLLETLSLRPELVVVELNGEILNREAYPSVQVREGDTLEVVHCVGGG
jgi:sulfur carrier protein